VNHTASKVGNFKNTHQMEQSGNPARFPKFSTNSAVKKSYMRKSICQENKIAEVLGDVLEEKQIETR